MKALQGSAVQPGVSAFDPPGSKARTEGWTAWGALVSYLHRQDAGFAPYESGEW